MAKSKPITAEELFHMEPSPWKEDFSYMRNRRGDILRKPDGTELNKRPKREWSNEGTHTVYFDDGTQEERPGKYVIKQIR